MSLSPESLSSHASNLLEDAQIVLDVSQDCSKRSTTGSSSLQIISRDR
jgi:hypothetical protein